MQGARNAFVVTAAHCLPFFPPCISASHTEERTYKGLVGQLGEEPTVWAECLFVDPISDLAVLGPPDGQALSDETTAYEALIGASVLLSISHPSDATPAWLLSLDGRWFECLVHSYGGPLWITNAAEPIVGGMSGSPILTHDGSALGILCTSCTESYQAEGGPNPSLAHNLPSWLVGELSAATGCCRGQRAGPTKSPGGERGAS
jgi:hypothetical protein